MFTKEEVKKLLAIATERRSPVIKVGSVKVGFTNTWFLTRSYWDATLGMYIIETPGVSKIHADIQTHRRAEDKARLNNLKARLKDIPS